MQARGAGPVARHALDALCRAYWFPLYAYGRRTGCTQHDAEDHTQAFLRHVLESEFIGRAVPEKGRFRSFLLGSLRNFIAKQNARQASQKRGGGQRPLDSDETVAEQRLQLASPGAQLIRREPGRLFVYGYLGEAERFFSELARVINAPSCIDPVILRFDPTFAAFRADARFDAILATAKSPIPV